MTKLIENAENHYIWNGHTDFYGNDYIVSSLCKRYLVAKE